MKELRTLLALSFLTAILFGSFDDVCGESNRLRLCGDRLIDLMTKLCADHGGIAKKRSNSPNYYLKGIRHGIRVEGGEDRESSELTSQYSPYTSLPYYEFLRKRSDLSICEDRDQSVYCMCCRSHCTFDELLTFCENPPSSALLYN